MPDPLLCPSCGSDRVRPDTDDCKHFFCVCGHAFTPSVVEPLDLDMLGKGVTEGPWMLCEDPPQDPPSIEDSTGRCLATLADGTGADDRLMAAAPDLLVGWKAERAYRVAIEAVAVFGPGNPETGTQAHAAALAAVDTARAALVKARGVP